MKASFKRSRGFTVVELLVVIAIIGVLLGLLMPALSGAKKQSAKTNEMNSLKQVGYAWQMYASNNGEAALPGFLETPVQAPQVMGVSRGWGVRYQYPDRTDIPPAPGYGGANNTAGPWTWRLLSYLDYSHEMVHGYLSEDDADKFSMINEATTIAEQPAFGYNGYYVGGYWQMQDLGDGVQSPVFKYYNHCFPGNIRLSVPTSPAQINRSSDMVLFCSAAKLDNGRPWWSSVKLPPDFPGWHLVAPPTVADQLKWRPFEQDPNNAVEILPGAGDTEAPIGRFTGSIATLLADGHCDTNSFNSLYDQRKWVNNVPGSKPADPTNMHAPCGPPPP